jgi:hypothetical protein
MKSGGVGDAVCLSEIPQYCTGQEKFVALQGSRGRELPYHHMLEDDKLGEHPEQTVCSQKNIYLINVDLACLVGRKSDMKVLDNSDRRLASEA